MLVHLYPKGIGGIFYRKFVKNRLGQKKESEIRESQLIPCTYYEETWRGTQYVPSVEEVRGWSEKELRGHSLEAVEWTSNGSTM